MQFRRTERASPCETLQPGRSKDQTRQAALPPILPGLTEQIGYRASCSREPGVLFAFFC